MKQHRPLFAAETIFEFLANEAQQGGFQLSRAEAASSGARRCRNFKPGSDLYENMPFGMGNFAPPEIMVGSVSICQRRALARDKQL